MNCRATESSIFHVVQRGEFVVFCEVLPALCCFLTDFRKSNRCVYADTLPEYTHNARWC